MTILTQPSMFLQLSPPTQAETPLALAFNNLTTGQPLTQSDRATLCDLAALVVFGAMQKPLQHLTIKEQQGRVLLIAFQTLKTRDPILPLPLLPLNALFWASWGDYARHLETFNPSSLEDWVSEGQDRLAAVLLQLARPSNARKFTPDELTYLRLKLALPLAWPAKGGLK